MKTPIQEHIEWMQEKLRILVECRDFSFAEVDECIQHAESMLKKERETICNAFSDARHGAVESRWTAEEYFIEIFDTKEK